MEFKSEHTLRVLGFNFFKHEVVWPDGWNVELLAYLLKTNCLIEADGLDSCITPNESTQVLLDDRECHFKELS